MSRKFCAPHQRQCDPADTLACLANSLTGPVTQRATPNVFHGLNALRRAAPDAAIILKLRPPERGELASVAQKTENRRNDTRLQ